jgi:hypothetical protein
MAVTSVLALHAIDAEQRSNFLRKVVRYRVTCNSESDGPDIVTAHASVPKVDISLYISPFKYGNDVDDLYLVCRSISNLKKENTQGVWILDAEFLYDRDKNPILRGVKVTPLTRVEQEIVELAEFRGWYKSDNLEIKHLKQNLVVDQAIADNDVVTLDFGKVGPMTNSAGTVIIPATEKRVGKSGIRVQWSRKSRIDFSQYIGTVNNATITLTDTYNNYSTGTFEAGELLLVAADQEPVDYFDSRWLDTTLEFEIVEGYGDIYQVDRGLAESVYMGDSDNKGGEYDSSSLPASGLRAITGAGDQPVSQPVNLNGKGKVIENYTPSKAIYLRYRINASKNFNGLEIGDPS